ncbi:hypothetical protein D3C85_1796590 [compost metagenome]
MLEKSNILKAYNVSGSTDLTYYIALEKDTTTNRMKFFEFISRYETLGLYDKLPITIKFLPKRVLEKSQLKNEVILN